MNKKYCQKCNTYECKYIELKEFVDYINKDRGKEYLLEDCPDKAHLDYTCDMVYSDLKNKERIFIELKKVMFGMGDGKEKNIFIGESRGQNNYASLVQEVVESMDDDRCAKLQEYIVDIPRSKITEKEKEIFCKKLYDKLMGLNFENEIEEIKFIFESKAETVTIIFRHKTENSFKFGKNMLVAYETEDDNTIGDIFRRMTDSKMLKKIITKNLKETSEKKFPAKGDRKILLNILELQYGYDMFFNLNLKYMIEEIMNMDKFCTAASESYLLYNCEEYMEVNGNELETYGRVMFVIPIIKGLISEPIGICESSSGGRDILKL